MDNREKILTSALDLFYARGYDAVGIQQIVDAAGLTKPTMYYYFGSKRGLLDALLGEQYEKLERYIDQAAVYKGGFPETLCLVAEAFFRFVSENRKIYSFMLSLFYTGQENEGHKAVEPLISRYYRRITGLFEAAAAELGNMNGRQKQFALGFQGLLDMTFLSISSQTPEQEALVLDTAQIRGIVKQFMYGIYS